MNGAEFKEQRIRLGFKKRSEAAEWWGVKPDTIKKWEIGKNTVPLWARAILTLTIRLRAKKH